MNREDIIRMAQEVGFEKLSSNLDDWVCFEDELERFFKLAYNSGAASEREACVKIVHLAALEYDEPVWAVEIINDIYERGNT